MDTKASPLAPTPSSPNTTSIRLINFNRHESSDTNAVSDFRNKHFARPFATNKVHTSKYNIFTFFSLFFYDQFSKPSNLFFLIVSCLQQIPKLSPTGRWGTLFPLLLILTVSGCKEIYEDIKRSREDEKVNSNKVLKLKDGNLETCKWEDVKVGDFVQIVKDEPIPADLILFASSEPEGFSYLETSNIDGESNLKLRQAHKLTQPFNDALSVASVSGQVSCEQPNGNIYRFEGFLKLLNGCTISLDRNQFIPRGSILKNTQWIIGLVVYTGHETKIMKNTSETPRKKTKMDRLTDSQTGNILILLSVLVLIIKAGHTYYLVNVIAKHHYIKQLPATSYSNALWESFKNLITTMLLLNNLVPISLSITLETVRVLLAGLIEKDLELYDKDNDVCAQAKSSNLVEELGQIEYVLTDKTGTLTCNQMVMKHLIIGNEVFPECTTNPTLKAAIQSRKSFNVELFLQMMATCHSVMIETDSCEYQASSPDELAIVKAASQLKFKFQKRSAEKIIITLPGDEPVAYDLLAVFEFCSDRKRMSTLLRTPDGRIVLFCKGADSVLFDRSDSENSENLTYQAFLNRKLLDFSLEGLRTLCFAYREISETEYASWRSIWDSANNVINQRQAAIDAAADLLEQKLILLGATGVEDRLQEGVPEAIAKLFKANIKVWMLTGDRNETAINTGYLSGMIREDNIQIDLSNQCGDNLSYRLKESWQIMCQDPLSPYVIIINSTTLEALEAMASGSPATDDRKSVDLFSLMAQKCKSLIASRLSPMQKSKLTEFVKIRLKKTTLAIGDGGNDVGMIQTADIGVGIAGYEGMQAARSADFTLGKFRFLVRLLLVHGSWSLHRLSRVTLFVIYKNFCLNLCQFWFAAFNSFSAQTICSPTLLLLFNSVITAAQPIIIGFTDQFVRAPELITHPQLYQFGQKGRFYNARAFWECVSNAVLHSFLIFFSFYWLLDDGAAFVFSGNPISLSTLGQLLYGTAVMVVNFKIVLFTNFLTNLTAWAAFGAVFIWFLAIFFFNRFSLSAMGFILASPIFWMALIPIPILVVTHDYIWKFYLRQFQPRPYHIIQEMGSIKRTKSSVRVGKQTNHSSVPQHGFSFSQSQGQAKVLQAYGNIE